MKHIKPIENSVLAHRLRDVSPQTRNRRNLWLAVAGLALTTSGVVYAQTTASNLPAPPAMPTPAAGAPVPGGPGIGAPMAGEGGPMMGAPMPGGPGIGGPGMRGPKVGGPGMGAPMPGGPGMMGTPPMPADAGTAQGAARGLERAYREAGEVTDSNEMSAAARSYYTRALSAYGDKNYSQASKLAEGSARLSRIARSLNDTNEKELPNVPGLTRPPVIATTNDSERASRELNRNYTEANGAANYDNAISTRYHEQSEASYRAALAAYGDKNYEEAAQRARLGAAQARAAREYAQIQAL